MGFSHAAYLSKITMDIEDYDTPVQYMGSGADYDMAVRISRWRNKSVIGPRLAHSMQLAPDSQLIESSQLLENLTAQSFKRDFLYIAAAHTFLDRSLTKIISNSDLTTDLQSLLTPYSCLVKDINETGETSLVVPFKMGNTPIHVIVSAHSWPFLLTAKRVYLPINTNIFDGGEMFVFMDVQYGKEFRYGQPIGPMTIRILGCGVYSFLRKQNGNCIRHNGRNYLELPLALIPIYKYAMPVVINQELWERAKK